ncbi:leucine-rich repeats and immunoglobulin-like domains protein 3 [Daphnia carinata]|uniref:leucine-rich repeats and immunoglobulin-like domains protein 3 n=1 Tax=Daphnia carinata TaxID=120202 RepID=UPI00257DB499|nr:leucine-rich repeats and immunoglobulin-like domains protein 3 [Daphnia carinata]
MFKQKPLLSRRRSTTIQVGKMAFWPKIRFGCGNFSVWCFMLLCLPLFATLSSQSSACPVTCSCLGTLVDCSKQGLTQVPKDLPLWTEVLELQENLINTFSSYQFSHLKNLQRLDLSNNRVKFVVPGSLANLIHLNEVKLNHNQMVEIPDLGPLVNLSSLNLAHNEILSMNSTWLAQTKSLKNLDLSHNKLYELPAGIFANGSRLQILNLSNNRLQYMDKGCFYNLTALVDLKLGRNRITSLPKELFKRLSALKVLELNRNRLTKIEGLTFDGLLSLIALRLRRNEISQLFDGAFFGLSSIQQLQLDFNNITTVTKAWLYGLNSMQQLGLSNNHISTVDKDAWEFCQQMWELDLSHNDLVSVEKSSLTKLSKLRQLIVDHNKISYVEEGAFANLPSLQILELNNNEISWTIEDTNGTFTELSQVTKLGLAANRIKSVARKAFAGMQGLKILDLQDNAIATIQDGAFSELSALEELRLNSSSLLCDCQLKWLPPWLDANGALAATVDLKCGHPEPLVGSVVQNVSIHNFTCDDFPKPFITEEPITKVALKEENVTLTCKAESTSAASPMNAIWKKDNLVFRGSQVVTFARSPDGRTNLMTSVLLLQNITDEDAGRYQCIVSNDFGSTYSSRAKITVHVFPTFTKTPVDIRVKAGNTARLECHAEGSPPPEIAWKKDGGDDFPAARERRMHVMSNDDVFFIVNVKAADMGVYSCTAQNVAGVIVANATLTVLETPSFVKQMEDREIVSGETTVLECMAAGSPKPRLNWTKDGGPLVATERHFFTADSQLLIIVHTRATDAGRYECEMSNPLGVERDSSMLTVIPTLLASGEREDESATIGIIIIAVVCCVVGTSIVWVIIIHQTRKRAQINALSSPSSTLPNQPLHATPSVPFPGVEFMAAESDDPDLNIDIDSIPTAILYPPDLEILAFKGSVGSTGQLYTYLADNNSDSEHSSSKDSGTGDSGRRSNSNEDVTVLNDNTVNHSLRSLNTAVTEASSSTISARLPCRSNRPRHNYSNANCTRTLSTFVPQPRANVHFTEPEHSNRPPHARGRMSLYEDRCARNSHHSMGSPVANYSLARHEV